MSQTDVKGGGAGRPAGTLARASVARLELYTSNRKPCAIDLSDNTNLEGAPPSVRAALADPAALTRVARYPSHYASELKRALADYLGVGAEHIVTGCGSDDVLDSAVAAFAGAGDRLAFSEPTFAMIPYFCQTHDLAARPVPFLGPEQGWDIDAERLLGERATITYVCSPNNPTGARASDAAMDRLLAEGEGLVMVDEAYVEYSGGSLARRAAEHGRLLVVRTLSKAFGIAGLRVGYAVGAPELVREVEKTRGPYKINAIAELCAVAALDHDRAWVERGVAEVLAAREKFVGFLRERGRSPLPSSSNFVLVPVNDAVTVASRLRERDVAVRPFPALPGIGDAVRVSIGPWSILERALPALDEVLACA